MRWEEHEKIAILESKILWVLKCLQNYKFCMEKIAAVSNSLTSVLKYCCSHV